NQSGGNLTIGNDLTVGATGTINHTGGTTIVTNATIVETGGTFNISGGYAAFGNTTIAGTVNQTGGNLTVNGEDLAAGGMHTLSNGNLTVANVQAMDDSNNAGIHVESGATYTQTGGNASFADISDDGTMSLSNGTMSTFYGEADINATGILNVSGGYAS